MEPHGPSLLWLACTHLQPYHLHHLADTKSPALICVWACAPLLWVARLHSLACACLRTLSFYVIKCERRRHLMVPRLWLGFIWCCDGSCWPKEFILVCIIYLTARNKHGTWDIFFSLCSQTEGQYMRVLSRVAWLKFEALVINTERGRKSKTHHISFSQSCVQKRPWRHKPERRRGGASLHSTTLPFYLLPLNDNHLRPGSRE